MDGRRQRGGGARVLKTKTKSKQKQKMPEYPLHSPSRVVRQALFPSGPGSYPSLTTPLHEPQQSHRRHEQQQRFARMQSDVDDEAHVQEHQRRRREMGWNLSFPAEYQRLNAGHKDYQHTLAYYQDVQQRQALEVAMARRASTPVQPSGVARDGFQRSSSFLDTTSTATTRGVTQVGSAQTQEERTLLQHVMLREGLVAKLHAVVHSAMPASPLLEPHKPPTERPLDVAQATELLHLLLQLRDAGVTVMRSVLRWHELRVRLAPLAPLAPFRFENHDYCAKMISDLDFLGAITSLGAVLGVDPATMRQNPFMLPAPIAARDFSELRELPWRHLRLFQASEDPTERVADAEQYLVWCLSNLQDDASGSSSSCPLTTSSSPVRAKASTPSSSPSSSSSSWLLKREQQQHKTTWQKRAEKQLALLARPLESRSGPTYAMDSSRLLKRQGVLPSLSQSPPKTLTELVHNVHKGRREPVKDKDKDEDAESLSANRLVLHAQWDNSVFSTDTTELEALGSQQAPPHHLVTLVAASVLILLSPSDRLPKDLSWRSCQRMLRHGARLLVRLRTLDVAAVPPFKWKALLPFLRNEHFEPRFLGRWSRAASSLCAWVFAVLAAAQQHDCERLGLHASAGDGDEDRLVLLTELEVDALGLSRAPKDELEEDQVEQRSKSDKHVSIGSAQVLFINEEQPVARPTPRHDSRSSSRRAESRGALRDKAVTSSALVRTSPWTFKGVTYFVSFFLEERSDEREAGADAERRLAIKMYEPMSSVESQMHVDAQDLRQDFGEKALAAFRSGEFRALCDLMLGQLDRIMGVEETTTDAAVPPPSTPPPVDEQDDRKTLLSRAHETTEKPQASALDLLLEDAEGHSSAPLQSSEQLETSALKIQCAARQQQARQKVKCRRSEQQRQVVERPTSGYHEPWPQELEVSVLKIQCAARQQQARRTVSSIHEEREQERLATRPLVHGGCQEQRPEKLEASVLRIQCATRQQQARRKMSCLREDQEQEQEEEKPQARVVSSGGRYESEFESEADVRAGRPETVGSYASEQFEDDFEADEDESEA